MIGGVIVQQVLQRFDPYEILDRETVLRLREFALDVLIISAIASLSLTVIAENIGAFAILGIAGIVWNVGAFYFLAPASFAASGSNGASRTWASRWASPRPV